MILQEAVYAELLTLNPVKAIPAPQIEPHQARYYELHDVQRLWQALL